MPRVDAYDVLEIFGSTDVVHSNIDRFITVANLVVTQHLAASGLSDALLAEVELWLAAHYLAIRDRRSQSESLGDASESYYGQSGLGLDFTPYGQQVKTLDPTGKLAGLGKRRVVFKNV